MIRRLSIADHAASPVVSIPMPAGADGRAPRVCLTLKPAGDMWGEDGIDGRRRRLFASLGIDEAQTRSLRQIHSTRVFAAEEIPPPAEGREPTEGDGLATDRRDLALYVRVADCYPIFLFDRRTGAFAVVHSGWRGTGIAAEALALMGRLYDTRPQEVAALLGPGIRPCCYNVPEERAALFADRFGSDSVERRNGEQFLDLASANIALLQNSGVVHITSITECTSCTQFLGSYRRQGPEHFTHMLALIGYFG